MQAVDPQKGPGDSRQATLNGILQGHTGSKPGTARLLYRGSLSIPDSEILLDGLTLTINLSTDDARSNSKLLDNPTALALESMRGRSLRYIGIEKMESIHYDFEEGIHAYVHPEATLSRQLFSDYLCSTPIKTSLQRTSVGIRIRLGDTDANSPVSQPLNSLTLSKEAANPGSNDIIIYGRPHPQSSILQLCVARILPQPIRRPDLNNGASSTALPKAVAKLRPPRPDDPTPRQPPAWFTGIGLGAGPGAKNKRTLDRISSTGSNVGKPREDQIVLRKKSKLSNETQSSDSTLARSNSSKNVKKPSSHSDAVVFKVPPLPDFHAIKKTVLVFGDKRSVPQVDLVEDETSSPLEASNKLIIKKATVRSLHAAGIEKSHVEFKDLYTTVYRGSSFALRRKMGTVPLSDMLGFVDQIISTHVSLYITGEGDNRPP